MARGVSGDAGRCSCLHTGGVTVTANPYAFLHTLGQKLTCNKNVRGCLTPLFITLTSNHTLCINLSHPYLQKR